MTKLISALRAFDVDGAPVVHVEMSNARGTFATFDAGDYEQLRARFPGAWRLNDNGRGSVYVRAITPGYEHRNVNLAREVLQPGLGRVVGYRDGNRLNLRRSNLQVQQGGTRRRSRTAST